MAVLDVTADLLAVLARFNVFTKIHEGSRWAVGDQIGVPEDCRIEPYTHVLSGIRLPLAMGAFSYSHSHLPYNVRIGRYCSLAPAISWMGERHPAEWASTSGFWLEGTALQGIAAYRANYPEVAPQRAWDPGFRLIDIGHDVWIGAEAMIAPGVTIGHGAIVAARALVLDDVPPYAIVGGLPARVIRYRFDEATVARFLATAWWRFAPASIGDLPLEDPPRFLDGLEERLATAPPQPISPIPLTLAALQQPVL